MLRNGERFDFTDAHRRLHYPPQWASIHGESGDTVLIDCTQPHVYWADEKLEMIWLYFSGLNSREVAQQVIEANGHVFRAADQAAFLEDLNTVFQENLWNGMQECEHSLLITRLICGMMHPANPYAKHKSEYAPRIASAQKYIAEHLGDSVTVGDLARYVHMSSSYFSRIFKVETGVSPYEYVLAARLNRAKEYLQNTDLSIAAIACEVGFRDEANFISFFRTNTGLSPGRFRALQF